MALLKLQNLIGTVVMKNLEELYFEITEGRWQKNESLSIFNFNKV